MADQPRQLTLTGLAARSNGNPTRKAGRRSPIGTPETRPPVRTTDNAASHDGAARIAPRIAGLKAQVLRVFAAAGAAGATNEDLYAAYPTVREDSLRPRVGELIVLKLLEEVGRRPGSRGVDITIWRLTALGRRVVGVPDTAERTEAGDGR